MIVVACDYCSELINEPDFIGVDIDDNWIADFIPIKSLKEYNLAFCNKDHLINFIEDKVSDEGTLTISFTKDIKIEES